jgi:rhamnulokinase
MANLIFHSLADRYAAVLQHATRITGRILKRLYVVGGGSRNTLLNQLTAKTTGLEVLAGSTESTTVGNFAIQLAALEGDYSNGIGVSASTVAKWAGVLTAEPGGPGNGIRAQKVSGNKIGIGEVLA